MPDSSFPETLPGLYLKRGLQLMGGNEESYLKLLLKFGKNQKDTIQKIKYCLADNDPMGARRLIHTLTGIAGNIGADELYASIIDLGEAIKKNRTSEWDGKTDVAQALMTQLCASIESLADKYNTAKESGNKEAHRAPDQDKTIDMDTARQLMKELRLAMEGSCANSTRILESLKKAFVDAESTPELGEMENLLDAYDFDSALEALKKLAARFGQADE